MEKEIDETTVKWLSDLSRMGCTDEEIVSLLKDLKKIIAYVEQLNEVDTSSLSPYSHAIEQNIDALREDEPGETLSKEVFLKNATARVGGLVRVPSILSTQE